MNLPSCFLRRLPAAAIVLFSSSLAAQPGADPEAAGGILRTVIERYTANRAAVERRYDVPTSAERWERLRLFHDQEATGLEAVDFVGLDHAGQVDYLLFKNHLRSESRQIAREEQRFAQVAELVPFAAAIARLEEARRRVEPIDPERAAAELSALAARIEEARKGLEGRLGPEKKDQPEEAGPGVPGRVAARRAAGIVEDLAQTLERWRGFYAGYHPEFTWWAEEPYRTAKKRLDDYATFLRRKLAGYVEGQDEPIIGDPIGREALIAALEDEMIPYSPEELIAIASEGFAWCEAEYRRAAQEMGLGDDWRRALERAKEKHVKPGEQPKLIKELAEEAIRFLEERDLVTIPPLAKETWRMEMMSPERQKVNPFFTGGEVISVSYPTDSMSYEERLMTLRGNNIPFCRATVHHELIPGHHLQGFMAARHRPYRRVFRTPFLVEGWALYWEMLLWDLGFPKTPEDRIGMLFWRAHRSARIVFSLNFHLGKMSPQEAIDYLVERVGHERKSATAEVRRSVAGDYGPLYQAAYMLGGLQIRSLRRELVESGKMKDREFHDAILKENAIPIAMIRASLLRQPLARNFAAGWRFREERVAAAAGGETGVARADDRAREEQVREERRGPRGGPSVPNERITARWLDGGSRFWYRADLAGGGRRFVVVEAESGATREASEAEAKEFAAADDGERGDGRQREGRRRGDRQPPAGRSAKSPDGRWEAFVRGDNLHLRDLLTKAEHSLSQDANPKSTYARDAARERGVEMRFEAANPDAAVPDAYWSPDSKYLVAMRHQPGTERTVYLIESSPRDQVQPKLQSYPYLKPGDEVPVRKPRLFDVEGKRELAVADTLFQNPWSIGDCRWTKDSARFLFLYNQRGHQALRLVALEAATGEAKAIIDERSETFIDYSGKSFLEPLDESGDLIWMSERDGWNHLYLYDARTGAVKNQITRGEWLVRGVDQVDRDKRQIWFRAGGIRPGQDPYYLHHCRVNFDGSGLTVLTEGDGTHTVQFSPDRRFLVDTWSRVDEPPVHELRSGEDGRLIRELERVDAVALRATGWQPPERFVAKGRDGVTDIYGVIHRPARLHPEGKHPVIESIYAGPQGSFVPKGFRGASGFKDLTDLGFIVVQIDGMGTSNRSKKFHDVCWKNLGDAGFPDRLLWLKAAAAKYPYLDLSRVGIFGGSAGGQNALRGLLAHGDFYKVGVADCGCHDNRMDKIWWNEQWMGWPLGSHYEESSNVTQAHRLQGKLLLMVGELDRNVDPASTLQVVNALIKADKDFDLLVIPGAGHGAGSGPYGRRRRNDFFTRHLLGFEPVRALVSAPAPAVAEEEAPRPGTRPRGRI